MSDLHIRLFGHLEILIGDKEPLVVDGQKVQELLCYLLVHRDRVHSRERLAALLWENSSDSQAKQYLRRALWQLQAAVDDHTGPDRTLLHADADWLRIGPDAAVWCDTVQFEDAYLAAVNVRGADLDADTASRLASAVALYRGDLLENWYQDWCIVKRENFQNMYLTMLDKLMNYCEVCQDYDRGIRYGMQVLDADIARERTYRRLMRLHCLAGDRTGALRLFERCVTILKDELDVPPSRLTIAVYECIREDRVLPPKVAERSSTTANGSPAMMAELLVHLENARSNLDLLQHQLGVEIDSIKSTLTTVH